MDEKARHDLEAALEENQALLERNQALEQELRFLQSQQLKDDELSAKKERHDLEAALEENQSLLDRNHALEQELRTYRSQKSKNEDNVLPVNEACSSLALRAHNIEVEELRHRIRTAEEERDKALQELEEVMQASKDAAKQNEEDLSFLRAEASEMKQKCLEFQEVAVGLRNALDAEQQLTEQLQMEISELQDLLEAGRRHSTSRLSIVSTTDEQSTRLTLGKQTTVASLCEELADAEEVSIESGFLAMGRTKSASSPTKRATEFLGTVVPATSSKALAERALAPRTDGQKAREMTKRLDELQKEFATVTAYDRLQQLAKKDRMMRKIRKQLSELKNKPPEPQGFQGVLDSVLAQLSELGSNFDSFSENFSERSSERGQNKRSSSRVSPKKESFFTAKPVAPTLLIPPAAPAVQVQVHARAPSITRHRISNAKIAVPF